jgi:type III restriction enzyme
LETKGYVFSPDIIEFTKSGKLNTLDSAQKKIAAMNDIQFHSTLDTHKHGRLFHHHVAEIGLKINLEYDQISTIIRKLFDKKNSYAKKILALDLREIYSFVLNNADLLRRDIRSSMATELIFTDKKPSNITQAKFGFPQALLFTFDGKEKNQETISKNVYKDYRYSAEPRSSSEKEFERYCEKSENVDWFYKNGDSGSEYFSVVYDDTMKRQHAFYPDYVLSVKDRIWIIETKGGFSRTGDSEDIDLFSPLKFQYLITYIKQNNLHGGFVRKDKKSGDLCICQDEYNDDISSNSWELLSRIF